MHSITRALLLSAASGGLGLALAGCKHIPGRPGPGPEVVRPDEVVDFPTLYKQNCAACHGENGRNGAAISLANPVYLALAGETRLRDTIANGVQGKLMPAFAKSAGGMLTDGQVAALARGIIQQWEKPGLLAGENPPPYLATLPANAGRGLAAYGVFCARCHGAAAEGGPADGKAVADRSRARQDHQSWLGSIVDPAYLALISDQNLRSITIAGRPDEQMPDWRTDAAQPMADQQITDILAWLASKRTANPGQPYPMRP
jgi:cytochrome c oxidase cbb3-type subunit 3/ubiquinol-cytochrome c reductase cytochrome c subunit